MTTDLITIREDTPAKAAIKILLDKRISGLPVVRDDMSLAGIISEKDFIQLAFYDSIDEAKVSDFMITDVITMGKEASLLEISELFMNSNYKRIPILEDNKLIGIISRKDILKYILKS
ncbi:MAG: CBS domain-containing protein [Spirochaetes bacterium]|nr:CBS domain-containing protein [Spirochaetota bacterium]